MADQLGYVTGGTVAVRDGKTDQDGRTIEGYAYRWGDLTPTGGTPEYPGLAEGFERGAFAPALAERSERPYPFLDRHGKDGGRVVGSVSFAEDDIGLRYQGRLLDTVAAREYAETVPAGNDGVSLEFVLSSLKSKRTRDRIMHTAVGRIAALAGAYYPAYQSSSVALRSMEGNVEPEIIEPQTAPPAEPATIAPVPLSRDSVWQLASEAAGEVVRGMAERGALVTSIQDPLAGYATLGELYAAAAQTPKGDELRNYAGRLIASRALDNVVFTAGANAGLARGNLVTERIAGIVNNGRPAITAFGGPRPVGDIAGLTLYWPYFDGTLTDFVGAQSAEKAEVTSGTMDIKLASEALVTYAGAADISYQVLRYGQPSALDAFAQIMLAAWAAVTDAAAVTELESGSATLDFAEALASHDLAEFIGNLVDASVTIQNATGQPAEFALLSSTAFAQYAKAAAAASTQTVVSPNFTIAGLDLGVGGIRLILDANVTAGKVIISNRQAGAWFEDGPFQAAAEDVAHLGRDVAYWSTGAFARFIPAAIIEAYDVTP